MSANVLRLRKSETLEYSKRRIIGQQEFLNIFYTLKLNSKEHSIVNGSPIIWLLLKEKYVLCYMLYSLKSGKSCYASKFWAIFEPLIVPT